MMHPNRHILLATLTACWIAATVAAPQAAADDTLESVWAASMDNQPLYLAGQLRMEAEQAELQALRRTALPELQLEAGGDYGQRVRPGEERDRGVAGRGEIIARVNWSLIESGRSSRERAIELARAGAVSQQAARDLAFRSEVARLYVRSAADAERVSIMHAAEPGFQSLTDSLRRRIAEGVAPSELKLRAAEAESRRQTQLNDAVDAKRAGRTALALLTNRDAVSPLLLQVQPPTPAAAGDWDSNPLLAELEREAERQRAEAEQLQRAELWRLDLISQTGPYFSGALDDGRQQEYFAGLRFTWTPDLAGVNRARSTAGMRRAQATEAERASLGDELRRRSVNLEEQLHWVDDRQAERARLLERVQDRERAESLRWREGLGDWSNVYEARENLLQVRLDELQWRLDTAMDLIEYAEVNNRLDDLPAWLGQPETSP